MPTNLGELLRARFPDARPPIDYSVALDDSGVPFISKWNDVAMGVAQPTEAQVLAFKTTYDAGAPKRDGQLQLKLIVEEWTLAMMVNARFGDNTRLLAVNAKIDAWKNAHPGVIP